MCFIEVVKVLLRFKITILTQFSSSTTKFFDELHTFFPIFQLLMGKHNEFGKHGEQLAVDFLIDKGYEILQRNYRFQKAEIDIIAKKNETLAVVEVKSRSTDFLENIADTVGKKKISLLVSAANEFVIANDLDVEVRFDIITILKKGEIFVIEHLKDSFYHF